MLKILDESTVVDELRRFRFLSEEAFCALTKSKDRCFVCLTAPGQETQEHIIPNWIIKLCGLKNQTISLSNGKSVLYPKYKVPCCKACNQALQLEYEEPISKAIKGGISDLRDSHLANPTLILRWMNLIFFKTHYKDLFVRREVDARRGNQTIGDAYDWGIMELPHAMLRAPFNEISLESSNVGSLFAVRILNYEWADLWDYRDDFLSGTIYIRVGDIVLIGVLNDAGITSRIFRDRFCVEGGGYVAQTLEMFTDCQMQNFSLKSKPEYVKSWDLGLDYTGIRIDLPKTVEFEPFSPSDRHKLLWKHLERYENLPMNGGVPLKDAKEELLQGQISLALKPRPQVMLRDVDILSSLKDTPDAAIFYGL